MNIKNLKVTFIKAYPEEFRKKIDAEKYCAKGTCEVSVVIDSLEIDIKNITYRIDHDGKVQIKPPYRVHSNKKAWIKPRLVPSIVFRDGDIWKEIEQVVRVNVVVLAPTSKKRGWIQGEFWH